MTIAPALLPELRGRLPAHERELADRIWHERDLFVRWPARRLLFMPGVTRAKYAAYTPEHIAAIRAGGLRPNTLSNGPALMAFALAGGERPWRANGREQWTVHHIYDGQYPAPGRAVTTHAVRHGDYFTDTAGLVAVHPVADALADELPYFAWLLRAEAFARFGFDPDGVFSSMAPASG